jgi:peptidoglycan/xylan/chitin deacetylase (PgdA/CDA1 family)
MTKVAAFSLTLLLSIGCTQKMPPTANPSKPYIILKLDDLKFEKGLVHQGWEQVVSYLNEKGVTGTIGLIGESLENGDSTYFDWIKARHHEGYEIWHHGFCHCKRISDEKELREYRGEPFGAQQISLLKTHQLAKEKLGITLRSFGAPYNSTDECTPPALAEIPDIKVWMFKETTLPSNKFILNRIKEVNIEYPVHVPDLEKFKAGYDRYKAETVLVIQGHPRSWVEKPERFEAFQKIIEFLIQEEVIFTTPYDFYLMQKDQKQG